MKNKTIITLIITIMLLLSGCQGQLNGDSQIDSDQSIQLVVTKNFGREIIFDQAVQIANNDSVMKVLVNHLEVETKYNGTFVNGIEGVSSTFGGKNNQQFDWFFYINGSSADVGANEYMLKNHDQVWWDFHEWGKGINISSVIGQFPEPFINGYNQETSNINIVSANQKYYGLDDFFKEQNIAIQTISLKEYDYEKTAIPTIVIMQTKDIKENTFINNLNSNINKAGLFAQIKDEEIVLYNHKNEEKDRIASSGAVVQSFSIGLGSTKPMWLIIGQDEKTIEKTIEILTISNEKILRMNSFAIKGQDIIRLPLE